MASRSRIALALTAGLLALAACGGASTGSPSSTSTPTANSVAAGACTNTWMPVSKGATWTLTSQNPPLTIVYRITDVSGTSFAMEATILGSVSTQAWNCTTDGLVNTSGNAFAVNVANLTATTKVISTSGVTFPPNVKPGDTWTESSTQETEISGMGKFTGTGTSKYQAIGIDQVTVPAGKFECLHVKSETTSTLGDGSDPTVFHIDAWYGRQKGFVKVSASTGGGATAELVLTSYAIP